MSSETPPSNIKPLYEFTFEVEREVEKETSRQEGDKTIVEKTKAKEPVPVFFAFKRPSREEREGADEYRASQLRQYVDKGFLLEALLVKRYANDGGILSDIDASRMIKAQAELTDRMEEYKLASVEKDAEKKAALSVEMMRLRNLIIDIQRAKDSFFADTAEAKARTRLIQYLILTFTYTRDSIEKPWERYFKGDSIEDRFKALDAFEDQDDQTFWRVWDRMTLLASLYVQMGGVISREEIAEFDAEFSNPQGTKPTENAGESA